MKLKPKTEKTLFDCLLIILAIFIPYQQVTEHRLTDYDDPGYITENIHVAAGLTWDSVVWAFTTTEMGNWHPLTWLSLFVDRELFGMHPGGYLLMNVAWHMLAACLCYLAFLRCTQSRIFSLSISLVFALHPVNVENVAWASERKSLLNAAFWFAAIVTYLDFIESKSFKAYGLTVIFFILSLFSKAMSVTLPCTLVLMHWLYLVYHPSSPSVAAQRYSVLKTMILPVLPLLVVSLYFSAVTLSAQSVAMPAHLSFTARMINALLSYQRYLVMFFHPTGLAFYYHLYPEDHFQFQSLAPVLLVLLTLSVAVLLLVRKKPQLTVGWLWFLGTMVPTIGLVQVGGQSHADRYLYIPMLGLAFIFPVFFEMLNPLAAWAKKILIGLSLVVLSVSMLIATVIQVSYWKDSETLCGHSLNVTGYCFAPMLRLAVVYARSGPFEKAISYIDSILRLETNSFNKGILATIKASVLYENGNYQGSMRASQKAIEWGHTYRTSYALLALSSYALGNAAKAAEYLAQAKSAPESDGILTYPYKPHLDWLELQLKAPPTPSNRNL